MATESGQNRTNAHPCRCLQCDSLMGETEQGSICAKCLFAITMKATPGKSGKLPSQHRPDWDPPLPEDLHRMLPQYDITSIIGRGGMAAVYLGTQRDLDRDVAIKILPKVFSREYDDHNFTSRFKQEAQTMAKLEHPGIVSVYDFGETNEGQFYFVMEYINGMDISQYLQNQGGTLSQDLALPIISQVLEALDYAHRNGIIHRDIKPANILINNKGLVKIADFGLAKLVTGTAGDSALALTMTDMAIGTPDFVAPETLEPGKTTDHRTDLYAVGVMLYQLLTGKLLKGKFRPPSTICTDLDPRLDSIVDKATESDPKFRYNSASTMLEDIGQILSQPITQNPVKSEDSVVARNASEPNKSRALKITRSFGVALAILFITGALAVLLRKDYVNNSNSVSPLKSQTAFQISDIHTLPLSANITSASKANPYENHLGMRFVPVPITGGPSNGQTVLFSVWETRVKDYKKFLSASITNKRDWPKPNYSQNDSHPAVMVTWEDSVAFCEWLTNEERHKGRIGEKEHYRLPSDHEWSCAVGIGNRESAQDSPALKNGKLSGVYPWGTGFPPKKGAGNYYGEETALNPQDKQMPITNYNDGYDRTAPVGSFDANEFGLYDLGGNVWEWCQDWVSTNEKKDRICRGSAWVWFSKKTLNSSHRGPSDPNMSYGSIGFRVVLAPARKISS